MRGIWKLNITIFLTALLFAMTGNSYAGNVEVKLPTNSAFQVISGVQPLMHVGSNGNVGIGTTEPGDILHVRKDTATVGASDIKLENKNNQGAARYVLANDGGDKGVLQAVGSAYPVFTNIQDDIELVRLDAGDMNIVFDVSAGSKFNIMGQARSEKVTVDINSGKVGIGTTSPNQQLEVVNGMRIRVVDNPMYYLDWNYAGIRDSWTHWDMSVSDAGNVVNAMTVRSNGNIGIGMTSPTYKLHVNGTAAGTSWTNLSSREFKEDINVVGESEHPMMLAKLMDMDLTRYRYKKEYGGDNEAKIGFIAEEMPKEVLSKDGKGVDVYELLTFTIGAMKAQQKEIEVQRQYNKALEDRLTALEKLLEGK